MIQGVRFRPTSSYLARIDLSYFSTIGSIDSELQLRVRRDQVVNASTAHRHYKRHPINANMPLPPFFNRTINPHTILITGGLTGIGRAIAILFLSHGANACINYFPDHNANDRALVTSLFTDALAAIQARNPSTNVQSVEGVPLECVPGDISLPETSEEMVRRCIEQFGRIDTFVSNAGICKFEEFLDISVESFARHRDTNLSGAFYATQAVARVMSVQSPDAAGMRGSIIGVSSISALVGGAQQVHYTPTKAGVLSLMQSCATALGGYGIRCNALLPGTIRTQLNERDLVGEKEVYMQGRIPLGRVGVPDDMGGPALFLAVGELSGYVTGAAILVDGGAFVNFQ